MIELEGGSYLPESNAILYYLAENTPYLPEDSFQRAQLLQQWFQRRAWQKPLRTTALAGRIHRHDDSRPMI